MSETTEQQVELAQAILDERDATIKRLGWELVIARAEAQGAASLLLDVQQDCIGRNTLVKELCRWVIQHRERYVPMEDGDLDAFMFLAEYEACQKCDGTGSTVLSESCTCKLNNGLTGWRKIDVEENFG